MGKNIVKLIVSLAIGAFCGLCCGIILTVVKIAVPQYYDLTWNIMRIIFWSLICIVFVVSFIIIGVSTIKEFNFMKLFNNELMYNGLTETVYNAASKRKNTYKKNKASVGYVGSVNMMINYLAMEERYDEAEELLNDFDFIELKDKMKIESNNPMRANMVTYFGLLDTAISFYVEKNNAEKVEEIYSIFSPLFNLCIAKYDYLTNVLYETKLKYLLFKKEFNEADSILDILKSNEPFLYHAFLLDKYKFANVTDKELIEKTYNDALIEAEKSTSKGFYKQAVKKKRDELLKDLVEEEEA
jgi:pentatricopeptide repeat protein